MKATKYESEIELTPRIIEIINFYKNDLPRYYNKDIGYSHSIWLNEQNLQVIYFYGFGYFYKIIVKRIDENS